jgi:hypothetical protein
MSVGPTAADPTRTPEEEEAGLPPTLRNMVTHWWDGSQLYGSDAATAARLREGAGGRMRLDGEGRLPLGQGGFGDAGVQANWWIVRLVALLLWQGMLMATILGASRVRDGG